MSELIRRSDPPKTVRRASEAETFRHDDERVGERTDYAAAEDRVTNRRTDPPAGDPDLELPSDDEGPYVPVPGDVISGRYRLLRSLGHGGMGQVWLAEVLGSEHPVALKWLTDELAKDPEIRARFRREIRASLAIRHAGVVHGLDLDRLVDGRDVLVMEYVEGRTLEEVLCERGKLAPRDVVGLGRKLAEALAATHDAGFLHRDLKPSNMIVGEGESLAEASIRLLDLGVCRDETEHSALSLTAHFGGVLGTPAYMAPEQLVGDSITVRSDVFSLGVVLYRMIAGQRPYPGSTFAELAAIVSAMDAPALAEVARDPARPAQLDELVQAMLAYEPSGRPESAREVAKVLTDIEAPRRAYARAAGIAVAAATAAFGIGFLMGRI